MRDGTRWPGLRILLAASDEAARQLTGRAASIVGRSSLAEARAARIEAALIVAESDLLMREARGILDRCRRRLRDLTWTHENRWRAA